MPEERQNLATRQGSGHSEQQSSTDTLQQPRHPERRNPEMLARAVLRTRESIQDKENMVPEKPGSGRQRRRRVSTSRSPLPTDYPRAPLQDITLYMRILERSRARARARTRVRIHAISPPTQPVIHLSRSQVTPPTLASEDPLQHVETTTANPMLVLQGTMQQSEPTITSPRQLPEYTTRNYLQLPEQESHGRTTYIQIEEQDDAQERALSHRGNTHTDSSLTEDVGSGFHDDHIIEEARAKNVSILANQEHVRAHGSFLQSETWNEQSGRGRGGSHPQPKKKSSLKPLMRMR